MRRLCVNSEIRARLNKVQLVGYTEPVRRLAPGVTAPGIRRTA
jgi:hypothetical protein